MPVALDTEVVLTLHDIIKQSVGVGAPYIEEIHVGE